MLPPCLYKNDVIKILSDSRHIKACIVLSLLVQAFLTIFAPLRKRIGGKRGIFFRSSIWLAYFLAHWIPIFTIGSISIITLIRSPSECYDVKVFWFWAPFLLLHLGGPDTITAFTLRDNELWLRHLFGLIFQVGSTVYVFRVSFPDNILWLPTLLVLIAGIIKYAERIYAFYFASFDHFGDNWVRGQNLGFYLGTEGETSNDQREERTAGTDKKEGAAELRIPVQFKNLGTSDKLHELPKKFTDENLASVENNIHQYFAASNSQSIVKAAVYLFGTIRRPLVGSFLSRAQLWKSFANLGSQNKENSAKEALQKIEIELSLLYEVLHTKWPVVVSKFGFLCRALNIGCIVGALVLFSLSKKHSMLDESNTWLTYGLLIGALGLDFISLILLYVWSDWFFIAYFPERGSKSVENFINRRRWSKTVFQLNFITYVVNDHPSWVKKCLSMCPCLHWVRKCLPLSYPSWAKKYLSWVRKWMNKWVKKCLSMCPCLHWVGKCLPLSYPSWGQKCLPKVKRWVRVKKCLSSQNFEDTHWRFIFEQVESLSKISPRKKKKEEEKESFPEWRSISIRPNVEWLTMIIDILEEAKTHGEVNLGNPSEGRLKGPREDPEQNNQREKPLEDLFKGTAQNGTKDNLQNIIREYDFTRSLLIFHIATELLLQHHSSSGSSDHKGTCKMLSDYLFYLATMKSTMLAPMLDSWEKVFGDTYEETKSVSDPSPTERDACEKILSADPWEQKRKVSVLILARNLAQELERYDNRFQMLNRIWVCLLAHAASNCRPNVHAKQPRKSGELLTFIWLCIANCGDIEFNRKMTGIKLV